MINPSSPWCVLAVAAALFVTDACGAGEGSAPQTEGAAGAERGGDPGIEGAALGPDEVPGADPALGEAVSIGLSQLPRKLDPLDDLEPWAVRIGEDLVFEGLVERSSEGYPWVQPALADRCEVDREYAVAAIYCHIPRGIRFHDGRELQVEDVVYSLSYWLDRRRLWIRQRHGLTNFDAVTVVDGPRGAGESDPGRWVQIGLERREPLALEALASVKIVPRELHRGREARFALEPVGTGPMRLSSLERDRIVLERFEDYRDPAHQAKSAKVVFRALDDGADALTALRRGEIHLLAEVAPVHIPVELGRPGMAGRFAAYLVSPPRYDLLLWNVRERAQLSQGLRQALHDALPLSAISREIYTAAGVNLGAPIDLHDPVALDLAALEDIKTGEAVRGGLLPLGSLDDDLAGMLAASASLDSLGWLVEEGLRRKPGVSLRVTVTWDGRSGRPAAIAEQIKAAWSAMGVTVPEASASWNYLLTLLRKGEFKVALVHLGGHSDEDLYQSFHSRGETNFAGVADAELDRALADYRGASKRSGRDAAKQRIAARLAALRVVSMIHAPAAVMLVSRRLAGIRFVDDIPRLDELSLEAGDIDWGVPVPH